jgi:hypothetical protein
VSNETFDLNGSASPQADDDALPAELTPVHERLVADGAAWRAHVPPAQTVIAGARARLVDSASATRPAQPANPSRQRAPDSLDRARPPTTTQVRPPTSLRRELISTSAAVLIVGLIGAVLYAFAVSATAPVDPGIRDLATATAVSSPTPVPNRWLPVTTLSGQPNMPMLAPSDPSVVYEVKQDFNAGTQTLMRSDNGGGRWRSLPVPRYQGAPVTDLQVRVSPVDAQMVFLQGGVIVQHIQPSSCDQISPVADARTQATTVLMSYPRSDSGECSLDYMSTDGGEHWRGLAFPVQGNLLQGGYAAPLTDLRNIQVQGNRIFLSLSYTDYASSTPHQVLRLVSSADGGKTWQAADSQLIQPGATVCTYRVEFIGVAIYADVSSNNCMGGAATPNALWRSDDGGAHWHNVGSLPASDAPLVDVAHGADDQHPVLVSEIGIFSTHPELVISQDDGATWQQAPTAGIPAQVNHLPLQVDPLADGTLVTMYLDPSKSTLTAQNPVSAVVFFAWKPGAASWRQATPEQTFPGQLMYAMVQGGDTLDTFSVTVVTLLGGFPPGPGTTAEVTRCGLSLSSAGG